MPYRIFIRFTGYSGILVYRILKNLKTMITYRISRKTSKVADITLSE